MIKFSINQDVGCLMYGLGKVIEGNLDAGYIKVEFDGNRQVYYDLNGRYVGRVNAPITLFSAEKYQQIQEFINNVSGD